MAVEGRVDLAGLGTLGAVDVDVRALIGRLEGDLGLSYDASASGARKCRTGALYRLRLGDRFFALKLYDEGYHNDVFFLDTLARTRVPVPVVHACCEADDLVGRPWILMDWAEGSGHVADPFAVGRHLGDLVRAIHQHDVDGAGARGANGWECRDWHELVKVQAERDRAEVGTFDDETGNMRLYPAIVDEFVRIGRAQPAQPYLLHGDLGRDNLVVHDDRVVAIIDSGWFLGGNPLMDVAYLMNSPDFGQGEGMRGFLEGYGIDGLESSEDVILLRMYHWLGKLIHCSSTGQRARYERTRQVLLDLVARHGLPRAHV